MNRIKTALLRRQPAILGLAALTAALVLMFSAISSAAVTPRPGTWKGKTSQGLPIEFVVKKGWKNRVNARGEEVVRAGVRTLDFTVRQTCTTTFEGQTSTRMSEVETGFPIHRADDGTIDSGNLYAQTTLRSGLPLFVWAHSGGGSGPTGSGSSYNTVRGKFLDRRKATGTLKRTFDLVDATIGAESHCESGKVRWTARR